MADTHTQPVYPRNITFEQVWASLDRLTESQKDTDRLFKESREKADKRDEEANRRHEEAARQLKESQEEAAKRNEEANRRHEETIRQLKASQEEANRQIKDINKRFGDYSNRLGEIAEYMVAPNLRDKFNELDFNFQKTSKNTEVSDRQNDICFEIDYFLENYSKAMLVEVKTKLVSDHVNAHIERLEKMRKYADLHEDKRTFLGAVAGVVIPDEIKKLALNQGLFVIEPSGETFKITSPAGNPKEW